MLVPTDRPTDRTLQGLTYALNEPCKEMLYLPTSDAIKFKAKGWIDVFGSRCAKGVGSFVTLSSGGDRRRLATYGGVASFLIRFGFTPSCVPPRSLSSLFRLLCSRFPSNVFAGVFCAVGVFVDVCADHRPSYSCYACGAAFWG